MDDQTTQVLLMVGTIGLTDGHVSKLQSLEKCVSVLLKGKYIYRNPEGHYKLTIKGKKAFKDAKRLWVIELGDLRTGETFDYSLDEWNQSQTPH